MSIQIGAYDENGLMIEDWSPLGSGFVISSGERGHLSLSGFIRKSNQDAAFWRERRRPVLVRATALGERIFNGRLEDVMTVRGGMRVLALGGFRAYSDAPYTRLWSTKGYGNWEPVTALDLANYEPALFEIDNNNRLFIGPLEGQTFDVTNERGGLAFKMPHRGEQDAWLVQFKFTADLPTNWRARLFGYDEDFTNETALWTQDGTGGVVTGATVVSLSPAQPYIVLALYRITSSSTYAADNATNYIELTDIRITSTSVNDVSTTLGTTILSGSQTVTPGSMVSIYVGQKLAIGGTVTEQVAVTAVTSTTFTAVFANGHNNTDTVKAIFVAADEVVGALIDFMAGINPGQVDDSKDLVQVTDRDLIEEIYEDASPADILVDLASRHNYEVGVHEDRALHFRPRGEEARTWYVDASVDLERTLEALWNSAYAVYADSRGRTMRTGLLDKDTSIEENTITRRAAVYVETTSEARAEDERDDFIDTYSDPEPRAVVTFDRVFAEGNVTIPLYFVRAGDRLVARNVSGNPSFTVARCEYDVSANRLAVEPLIRPVTLADTLMAGLAANEKANRLQHGIKDKVRVI